MIAVTRLNGNRFVINVDQIRYLESAPDTVVSLIGGDRIMVKETPEQVIDLAIQYHRQIHAFPD